MLLAGVDRAARYQGFFREDGLLRSLPVHDRVLSAALFAVRDAILKRADRRPLRHVSCLRVRFSKSVRYRHGRRFLAGAFSESTAIGTAGEAINRLILPDAEKTVLLNNIPALML
jgi:hypothetical protein